MSAAPPCVRASGRRTSDSVVDASRADTASTVSANRRLQTLLDHWIRRGCVTEVSGPRGVGKTHLALACACRAIRDNAEVIILDTEGGMTSDRLQRIEPSVASRMHRIQCFRPSSMTEVLALAYCMDAGVIDTSQVALVIVDTLASVVRSEFVPDRSLARLGLLLQRLAHQTNAIVLVLNHVSFRILEAEGPREVPCVERIWASLCTVRIQLIGRDQYIVWKGHQLDHGGVVSERSQGDGSVVGYSQPHRSGNHTQPFDASGAENPASQPSAQSDTSCKEPSGSN